MKSLEEIIEKMSALLPYLNEDQVRLYAASEAKAIGRGGKRLIEKELGISHHTINKGLQELSLGKSDIKPGVKSRQRKEGGGRKKSITEEIWKHIETFIRPHTNDESESAFQWVGKSLRNIESALKDIGINVSHRIVGEALKANGFSLQSARKQSESKGYEDRDAQFEYIQKKADEYVLNHQPVISIDAKKRKLAGNISNNAKEWYVGGNPEAVNAYDFPAGTEGIAVPSDLFDILENIGWTNERITNDTAELVVQSVRNWWYKMGICYHNTADRLLITADGGDGRLWKYALQKFADETGLEIEVLHFPPGTSKWKRIEHRLFYYGSKSWRGKPLPAYQVIVQSIAGAKTQKELKVACQIDETPYKTGIEITDKQLNEINICRNQFHQEWNYSLSPL